MTGIRRISFLCLWALSALAGCKTTPTQVVVIVDAEDGVRERADALRIVVEGRDERDGAGKGVLEEQTDLADEGWPLRVALVPSGDDASRVFRVTATALDGDSPVASASILSSYVEDELRWVRLFLEDDCIGVTCGGKDETCREGACASAWVDPSRLGGSEGDAPSTSMLLPPRGDAGVRSTGDGGLSSETCAEDEEGTTRICGATLGACTEGQQACTDGMWESCLDGDGNAVVLPVEEDCGRSEDEDCDGSVDEGCSCTDGDTRECGTDTGECETGTQRCSGETWGGCKDQVEAATEECDGLDNDCDGSTDEELTRECGSDVGMCELGMETCDDGTWGACTDEVEPTSESCDQEDEDCDGYADEALGCVREGSKLADVFGDPPLYQFGQLRDVDVGPQGDIAVAGYACDSGIGGEACSLWLAKLNADLTIAWSHQHHSGFDEYQYFTGAEAFGVAVDSEGAVIVVGTSCDGGVSDDCRIWVRKYSPDGTNVEFTDIVDAASEAYAKGVDVDASDNIVVTGYTSGAFGEGDIWTRKYEPDGTEAWTRTFNSAGNYNDVGEAVRFDSRGAVIVLGTVMTQGLMPNTADAWLRKYDANGNTLWTQEYAGTEGWAEGRGVAIDANDDIYAVGRQNDAGGDTSWIRKFAGGDGSPGIGVDLAVDAVRDVEVDAMGAIVAAGEDAVTGESDNVWARRWTSDLEIVWTRTYDQSGDPDRGFGVAVDPALNVYAVGYTQNGSAQTFVIQGWGP